MHPERIFAKIFFLEVKSQSFSAAPSGNEKQKRKQDSNNKRCDNMIENQEYRVSRPLKSFRQFLDLRFFPHRQLDNKFSPLGLIILHSNEAVVV